MEELPLGKAIILQRCIQYAKLYDNTGGLLCIDIKIY